jgi:hypothetical protein
MLRWWSIERVMSNDCGACAPLLDDGQLGMSYNAALRTINLGYANVL